MESQLIKTAESIALLAHGEHFDHSKRVVLKGKTKPEIVLGYLHDVIEDSGDMFDYVILSKTYKIPDYILKSLYAITRVPSKTYFNYIKRITSNELAKQVKIYDLKDYLYYKGAMPESLIQRYEKALKILK